MTIWLNLLITLNTFQNDLLREIHSENVTDVDDVIKNVRRESITTTTDEEEDDAVDDIKLASRFDSIK
jgi:hypothetical protein